MSDLDPELAADGVAEFCERMFTSPLWTIWPAESGLVELRATDLDQHWYLFADDAGVRVEPAPVGRPIANVSGRAADLDLALWRRTSWADLTFEGDLDAIEALLTGADLT